MSDTAVQPSVMEVGAPLPVEDRFKIEPMSQGDHVAHYAIRDATGRNHRVTMGAKGISIEFSPPELNHWSASELPPDLCQFGT